MKIRVKLVVLLAGAAAVLSPVLPASAQTDPPVTVQTVPGCIFTVVSLKAVNLRHDGGEDDVFLKVDDTYYPDGNDGIVFGLNTVRSNAFFDVPPVEFDGDGLAVQLLTDDFPVNHRINGTIQCAPTTNDTHRFTKNGTTYDLVYTVTSTVGGAGGGGGTGSTPDLPGQGKPNPGLV